MQHFIFRQAIAFLWILLGGLTVMTFVSKEVQSQNINIEDSIISHRLQQISGPIQLPWAEAVSDAVRTRTHNAETARILGKFLSISPQITLELKKKNFPIQLQVLPMAMSGMDNLFTSTHNKAGLWGLDAAAAIRFGLTVTPFTDERYDYRKAMNACMDYLSFLFDAYNDWWLVLLAYANSPAVTAHFLENDHSGHILPVHIMENNLITEKQFILDFIFYNYLLHYYEEHGVEVIIPEFDEDIAELITLKKPVHVNDFFEKTGLDFLKYRIYNPTYVSGPLRPDQMVTVPPEAGSLFHEWEDSLYLWFEQPRFVEEKEDKPAVTTGNSITYTVKRGDNLGAIAARHGVSVSNLKSWNNLKSDLIHPGQKLMIYAKNPPKAQTQNTQQRPATQTSGDGYITYTVKQGDTLWGIAQKFKGIDDDDIRKLNNLSGTTIQPGQVLKIKRK
jgi:membrane-bound lytic murein transglycosylase D